MSKMARIDLLIFLNLWLIFFFNIKQERNILFFY